MTTVYRHRSRNKHMNGKLHHFRDYMTFGEFTILLIGKLDQESDYQTKAFNQSTLGHNHLTVQGW